MLPTRLLNKYLYRTSMMNFPKGVDRYRLQNEMIRLYYPGFNYGVVEIVWRNSHFIDMNAEPEPAIQIEEKKP